MATAHTSCAKEARKPSPKPTKRALVPVAIPIRRTVGHREISKTGASAFLSLRKAVMVMRMATTMKRPRKTGVSFSGISKRKRLPRYMPRRMSKTCSTAKRKETSRPRERRRRTLSAESRRVRRTGRARARARMMYSRYFKGFKGSRVQGSRGSRVKGSRVQGSRGLRV